MCPRIAAEMSDDAIGEDAPGQHLGPAARLVDFELPGLAAHGVAVGTIFTVRPGSADRPIAARGP